jgi:hypothetical protein
MPNNKVVHDRSSMERMHVFFNNNNENINGLKLMNNNIY